MKKHRNLWMGLYTWTSLDSLHSLVHAITKERIWKIRTSRYQKNYLCAPICNNPQETLHPHSPYRKNKPPRLLFFRMDHVRAPPKVYMTMRCPSSMCNPSEFNVLCSWRMKFCTHLDAEVGEIDGCDYEVLTNYYYVARPLSTKKKQFKC